MAERNLLRELGQHLTGMDNMCFQLEHPRRLMTICSVWTFSQRLDTTLVMAALENLCTHHPRFCLVPKNKSPWETPVWYRPQQHWNFRDNFSFHTLTKSTMAGLQQYMACQYVKPFNNDKPLWEAHLLSGLENKQFAFLWKVHHSMSDSIGLINAVLATATSMDPKEEMTRQKYQQLQFEKARRKFGILWQQMMMWFLWGWILVCTAMQQVTYELWIVALLLKPWFAQLRRLSLLPIQFLLSNPPMREWSYDDDQTLEKLMAWTEDLDRRDIDKILRILGGSHTTPDDVVFLVLGRTMQTYLQQQQKEQNGDTFRVLIPVSFRLHTDWSMRNAVLGSLLELNLGNNDTTASLNIIHQHTTIIQRSMTAYILYDIIIDRLLRYFPFLMTMVMPLWIQKWYTDLPHATITNIVGPTTPVFFGGQKMEACHVFPPQCGKGSISIGAVSYGDKINLSMLTDNHPAYPDLANALCKIFVSEFNAVVDEAMEAANGFGVEGIIM
ncbi:hypothetical protein BCR42DRAFT_475954 [Absidia repens]|uniref:Uncharacterized protein n=1 Tax=Absidia repens TaxID=90262 RepID=A0A1X2IQ41_9FUNG|nr:hypothetical protein BCR42DRAFT_475954 [Absidia repens]